MNHYTFKRIGTIRSPWKEKFAVPRQPGLITDGDGELHLEPPYNQPETLSGLIEFSHLWLLFVFHKNRHANWHATVRPPRLGGCVRKGIFATRAPFRPNPIGLSLVELKNIRYGTTPILDLGSLDLVDGTPIIDIKPYLPYAEAKPNAMAGYASCPPPTLLSVTFSANALKQLAQYTEKYPHLSRLITQVLAQDPRPAWDKRRESTRPYSAWIMEYNVTWFVTQNSAEVININPR